MNKSGWSSIFQTLQTPISKEHLVNKTIQTMSQPEEVFRCSRQTKPKAEMQEQM